MKKQAYPLWRNMTATWLHSIRVQRLVAAGPDAACLPPPFPLQVFVMLCCKCLWAYVLCHFLFRHKHFLFRHKHFLFRHKHCHFLFRQCVCFSALHTHTKKHTYTRSVKWIEKATTVAVWERDSPSLTYCSRHTEETSRRHQGDMLTDCVCVLERDQWDTVDTQDLSHIVTRTSESAETRLWVRY